MKQKALYQTKRILDILDGMDDSDFADARLGLWQYLRKRKLGAAYYAAIDHLVNPQSPTRSVTSVAPVAHLIDLTPYASRSSGRHADTHTKLREKNKHMHEIAAVEAVKRRFSDLKGEKRFVKALEGLQAISPHATPGTPDSLKSIYMKYRKAVELNQVLLSRYEAYFKDCVR